MSCVCCAASLFSWDLRRLPLLGAMKDRSPAVFVCCRTGLVLPSGLCDAWCIHVADPPPPEMVLQQRSRTGRGSACAPAPPPLLYKYVFCDDSTHSSGDERSVYPYIPVLYITPDDRPYSSSSRAQTPLSNSPALRAGLPLPCLVVGTSPKGDA